jgi:alkaline phosphatase D
MTCTQLWLGALTSTSITAVAKLALSSSSVKLACFGSDGSVVRSSDVETVGNIAKLTMSGLQPNTAYTCRVEPGLRPALGLTGCFRTPPSGNASFKVAFSGDASERSNHAIFDTLRGTGSLMFIHMGDMHYNNITTNNAANMRAAYDEVFAQPRQSLLYSRTPTAYVWDDHDYSDNNSSGGAANKAAAAAVYRERVPHYPLPDSTGVWQTWDIGRVRFIMTDQRSAASPNSNTDNPSKTMLGATQKAWFKNLLSNSPGKLIVWICPRMFGGVATAGADHWGGFSTERREIVDYIKANCHGRVVVLSADMHALGIDDGSHHDYATGGGEPLRTFQAAPLDRSVDASGYGGSQFTSGLFTSLGQYGTMEVTDSGGSSIDVRWTGFNSSGVQLATSSFTVAL